MKRWLKRLAWAVGVLAALVVAVGAAVSWLRPDLLPTWARAVGRLTREPLFRDRDAHAEVDAAAAAVPVAPVAEPVAEVLPIPLLAAATAGTSALAPPRWDDVRLADERVAGRIGLRTVEAEERLVTPQLAGNAEVAYNGNLYAEVRPRVSGIIAEVLVDEGSPVQGGQPLLMVDSAEVGTAKADLLAALPMAELAEKTLEMTMALRKTNAAPLKDELNARAAANTARAEVLHARQHLLNLGYSEAELGRIVKEQDTSNLYRVVAPLAGAIVERHAVPGESVQPTDKVFGVADTSQMWAWVDVDEDEIEHVVVGQPVGLTISGTTAPVFEGVVDWIDAAVNPATRTIRVRTALKNQGGRLRSNQFGRGLIRTGADRPTVVVPRESVQEVGGRAVVFEPISASLYRPRPVVLGPAATGGGVEIAAGLEAGRSVVAVGSFLLKTELVEAVAAGAGE